MFLNKNKLHQQIRDWLEEDVGPGDVTSWVTVPEDLTGTGIIHAKGEGILAGIPVLQAVFFQSLIPVSSSRQGLATVRFLRRERL